MGTQSLVVLAILSFVGGIISFVSSCTLPTGGDPLKVDDLPYEFTLQDLQGNTVRLGQFIGQPILINFWAT